LLETVLDLVSAGLLLVFAGEATILVATLLSRRDTESRVRGGAVVLVRPVPVAFGSDARWASITIALMVVFIVATFLLHMA
jgi:uncharacterized protein (TIGR00304 family)